MSDITKHSLLTERHFQSVWYDSEFRPLSLQSSNGSVVKVVSPGIWNLGPGPDFLDATLEVGENHTRLKGDVELHLDASDWDHHRHSSDVRYRNVVAHLVFNPLRPTKTTLTTKLSLSFKAYCNQMCNVWPYNVDVAAYPLAIDQPQLKCKICTLETKNIQQILRAAGDYRIRQKAMTMKKDNIAVEQAFYERVLKVLGYPHNGKSFQQIAQMVPYDYVKREPENLNVAYAISSTFVSISQEGVRPMNKPMIRLKNAARLLTKTKIMQYMAWTDFSPAGCRSLITQIKRRGYIGKGRAAALIANVIVPFALSKGIISAVPDWLPIEDIPQKVRIMANRLLGHDHNASKIYGNNGLCLQGMIQIYDDYCARCFPECENCGMI